MTYLMIVDEEKVIKNISKQGGFGAAPKRFVSSTMLAVGIAFLVVAMLELWVRYVV